MVCAGVVRYLSEWPFGGYNEIQAPRRKNSIIAYKRLRQLSGFPDCGAFESSYRKWVNQAIGNVENKRNSQWTESIAVGSEPFLKRIKTVMGAMAKGRTIRSSQD
jgi:REP-associated tyrosine transposase